MSRSYGYHRGTILAVTGVILYEGLRPLGNTSPSKGASWWQSPWVAFAISAGAALVLREHGSDLNMEYGRDKPETRSWASLEGGSLPAVWNPAPGP